MVLSISDLLIFLLLSLAIWRVCRLIVEDTITEPIRDCIWARFPPATPLGYLLTCYWCTSIYVATLFVVAYILIPYITVVIAAIFALSQIVGTADELRHR